jgi:uncharacterized coiled-coil protein SlyX
MFVKELVSDMILLFMSNGSDRLMIITGKVLCFWRSLNCFVQHRVNYYHYAFQREQQLAREQFEDEKARLEREITYRREQMEKELADRGKAIVEKGTEFSESRKQTSAFPKELQSAVNQAVKEAVQRVESEAKNREELLRKEFDGERNVLNTRIESLEKTVTEQNEHIAKLSQQVEKAYSQVQDIATKAIESTSQSQSLTSLQQLLAEQTRKQSQET